MNEIPDLNDFHFCWHFLNDHIQSLYGQGFENFQGSLDIMVAKVSPASKRIVKDAKKNTLTQGRLEWGPWAPNPDHPCWFHDWEVDCGADTFEEAIMELASLVYQKYGNVTKEMMFKLIPDEIHGKIDKLAEEAFRNKTDMITEFQREHGVLLGLNPWPEEDPKATKFAFSFQDTVVGYFRLWKNIKESKKQKKIIIDYEFFQVV